MPPPLHAGCTKVALVCDQGLGLQIARGVFHQCVPVANPAGIEDDALQVHG